MARHGRLFLCAIPLVLCAFTAAAQLKPQCSDNLLSSSTPYPAPTWTQLTTLNGTPDYIDVSNNFKIMHDLQLLESVLQKALSELQSGSSAAGTADSDGACLCNCNQHDAAYWANYVENTVSSECQRALQKTEDDYLADLQVKIDKLQQTIYGFEPSFENDIETIVKNNCSACTQSVASQSSALAKSLFDSAFGPQLTVTTLQKLKADTLALLQDVQALIAKVAAAKSASQLLTSVSAQDIRNVIDKTKALYRQLANIVTALKSINPQTTLTQFQTALQNQITQAVANGQQAWNNMQAQMQQRLDARIHEVQNAANDAFNTATDGQAVLDNHKNELESGFLADFASVKGCYGITKRSQCTLGAFCAGTSAGNLFGSSDLALPLWIPTEVFKDGKSAVRWAFETVKWLKAVRDALGGTQATQHWKDLLALVKNGQQLAADVNKYVDTYTDGFHLGAYSDIRPDLHYCVGYFGHGVMAEVFSTSGGNFRGGADYLSANLVKQHRVQFRAGGFALSVNGHNLPLAPGVSLNAQIDGFRLWDRVHPFGIGGALTSWSIDKSDIDKIDVFSLKAADDVCDPVNGLGCPITFASLIAKGYFPIHYMSGGQQRDWPRTGVSWEKDTRVAAVFGAGLNLDLQMKTQYWSVPPIPIFPGATLKPWLMLDAGVDWMYGANKFRDTLQEQINKSLVKKLTAKDFDRDYEPLQAPDVTEDVGNGAFVKPKLGADLTLGFAPASWLEIGITASLYVAIDVKASGTGGILDLNRSLIDTLAKSNPSGTDCKPKIEENTIRVCSNEPFKKKNGCAGAADPKNCKDYSTVSSPPPLYSTGTYTCNGSDLGCSDSKGYCTDASGAIVAHDVTRTQCETAGVSGHCVAPYRDNPINDPHPGPTAASIDVAIKTLPSSIWPGTFRQDQIVLAQRSADPLTTQSGCEALGWCFHWAYEPGIAGAQTPYVAAYMGTAASRDACPSPTFVNPYKAQFIRFEWQNASPAPKGTFHPYQCVQTPKPVLTYTGPDCNPLEFGYPTACPPGQDCSCDPAHPNCPTGRTCSEGACLTQCDPSKPCAKDLKCQGGVCVMVNGLPFAEQIVWRMRNAAQPQHAVASYGLNKLVAGAALGLGVRVGMRYRIFKKWRDKNLLDLKQTIPLAAVPLVKHQLGLEAQYQNDCVTAGQVINHQPDMVKRYTLAANTPAQFAEWCKPIAAADSQNPQAPQDVDSVIGAAIDKTFDFGTQVGVDFWARGQMCAGGKTWDQYLSAFKADPSSFWPKLQCRYGTQTLDCTTAAALQNSLTATLGCLNASASPQNTRLLQRLTAKGVANAYLAPAPAVNVFDLRKLLVDPAGELTHSNIVPAILALESEGFDLNGWLAALDNCTSDAPTGRYDDAKLDIALKLDDFKPCGGSCCGPDGCGTVQNQSQCRGIFTPAAICSPGQTCNAAAIAPPPKGACVVFGKCQEVISENQCQGSTFYPGKLCTNVPSICAQDSDCRNGTWCRASATGATCVPFEADGGHCDGFTSKPERCGPGFVCTDFIEPTGDAGGFCRRTCTPPPSGLAAWWPLDETAGPLAAEYRARNDGRTFNGAKPVAGVVGNALAFNGTDGYLEVPSSSDLNVGTGDFSIVMWVRTSQSTDTVSIVDKRTLIARRYTGYHVYLTSGRPGLQIADGTNYDNYTSTATIADGKWHLLAVTVTRNAADGARWYVDGQRSGVGDPRTRKGSLNNASPLRFGMRTASRDGWWNGQLDEPALYDRALTAAEITRLRDAGAGGVCKCITPNGVEAWWTLNAPTNIYDSTGNGHNGMVANGPRSIDGVVGPAISFDGVDDYMEVPNTERLNVGTGDFSIVMWIRTSRARGTQSILDKRFGTRGFHLFLLDGVPGVQLEDGSYDNYLSTAQIGDGKWHLLIVSVTRSMKSGIRFYVDGQLAGSGDPTRHSGTLSNGSALRIATRSISADGWWKGDLDEVAIYKRSVPPAEALALYRARSLGVCYAASPYIVRPAPAPNPDGPLPAAGAAARGPVR